MGCTFRGAVGSSCLGSGVDEATGCTGISGMGATGLVVGSVGLRAVGARECSKHVW